MKSTLFTVTAACAAIALTSCSKPAEEAKPAAPAADKPPRKPRPLPKPRPPHLPLKQPGTRRR